MVDEVKDVLALKLLCHNQQYGALLLAVPAMSFQDGTTALQVVVDACGYLQNRSLCRSVR